MSALPQHREQAGADDLARLRVPPHSIEAEHGVLGSLLIDNAAWERASEAVRASDFYRHEHRLIFGAIGELIASGKPADVITVYERLQSAGTADDCGGVAYLNQLAQTVPSASNLPRYSEIVRDRARLREWIAASDRIAAVAFGAHDLAAAEGEIETVLRGIAEHAPQKARATLRAVDVAELAQTPFHARKAILGPWLHSQDLCMIFAARGIGKTHFALSIAFAVATGGTFLRWHAPAPAKVLYLDGELPGTVMQRRLLAHCPDVEPAPGFLRAFTPDLAEMDGRALPDLATTEGQAEIDKMIEPDTALVIVDNLSAWARTGRENDAESWHPVAGWILALRRRGVAVILVHHAGKGGQQRGTSKKEDLLDVVIGLSRPIDYDPQQGAVFVAEFTKARNLMGDDAQSIEATLGGDDTRAAWTWRTAEASTFDRVITLANEGLRPNEIACELEVNKSTVSRHLRKARADGLLTVKEADRGAS